MSDLNGIKDTCILGLSMLSLQVLALSRPLALRKLADAGPDFEPRPVGTGSLFTQNRTIWHIHPAPSTSLSMYI